MADKTVQDVYEEDPLALARAYGAEPVDPDETVESAKAVGQFALESLPGVGTAFTVADIEDELKKEDPNYLKIGMLVGTEAIGLIPGLGTAAKSMIRKGADMARQTDEAMDVASNIPKVSRKSTPSYTDAELLEADEIISEWGKGNLTNPELRSKLRDKGFNVETKRISPKMTGDDLEVVGPDGNIVRWKDMPRGRVDREADAAEAARLRNDPDALEQWRKENKLPESQRQKNIPEAQAAAQALIEGTITSKEARKRIKEAFPEPREYTAEEVMDLLPTLTEVQGALGAKGTRKPILGVEGADLKEGQIVSSRLDIPAYDDYDKWVVSIHDGNQKAGTVVGYGQAIRLKNIRFGSDADTALDIARGIRTSKATGQDAIDKKTGEVAKQNKATIARIFGEYTSEDPYDLQRRAAEIIASGSDEWVQVGMNPYRKSAFYNKKTGMPVFEADEIIQVGPLVLAKNVKKPTISQMKEMAVRTKDGKIRLFNEGGTVMNEQMEMAFMQEGGITDDGMDVDPVSGNEVPPGSLAKEVRDDIPAQLSEGEYVVPADVVRYYGVRFFEDLRDQAKMGLADMEANGRIGGEPVPEGGPQMGGGLSDEEKAAVQEIMSGMSQGGMARGYAPGGGVTPTPNVPTMTPAQLTQPTQYTQPNYSFLSPSASQVQQPKVEQPPEQPQVEVKLWPPGGGEPLTFQSPKDDVAIKDLEMQGYTRSPQTQPNDDGPPSTPPPTGGGKGPSLGFKNWGEEVDWSDPDAIMKFVNDSREGLIDPKTGSKLTQVGVALGGPGLGTLAGVAGSVPQIQSVSDMRAAAIVARAQGMDSVAAKIDGQIEEVMKNASGFTNFIDKFFGEAMDGDAKAKARLNKLGLKFDEDDNGNPTFTPQQVAANKTKMGGTSGGGKKGPSAARLAQQKRAEENDWSYDPDPKFYDGESTGSLGSTVSAANEAAGSTRPDGTGGAVSSTITDAGTAEQEVSGGTQAEQEYVTSAAAGNKGGLMNKAALKRKAKSQYKKGGLANKK